MVQNHHVYERQCDTHFCLSSVIDLLSLMKTVMPFAIVDGLFYPRRY